MIKELIMLGIVLGVAGSAFSIMMVYYKAYMRRKSMINNEYDNYPNE